MVKCPPPGGARMTSNYINVHGPEYWISSLLALSGEREVRGPECDLKFDMPDIEWTRDMASPTHRALMTQLKGRGDIPINYLKSINYKINER